MTVTGNSQHRFPRHKPFLDALCGGRAGSVDTGKARGFIRFDLSKAFGMASHSILVPRLVSYELGRWTSRKMGQTARLRCWFWGTKSNWELVSSTVPQDEDCPYLDDGTEHWQMTPNWRSS